MHFGGVLAASGVGVEGRIRGCGGWWFGGGFGGLGWLVDGVMGRIGAWRGEVGRGDGGRVWGDAVRAVAPRCRARGGRAEWRAVHPDLGLRNGRAKCTLDENRGQVYTVARMDAATGLDAPGGRTRR